MKISTKGRYALRFLLDLSYHQDQGSVSLGSIAERQDISKKYLEHIVTLLTPLEILLITRGHKGGYRLLRHPSKITVAEVLCATEGNLSPVPCLQDEKNTCARCTNCMTLKVWSGLERVIVDYLEGITLQSILDEQAYNKLPPN